MQLNCISAVLVLLQSAPAEPPKRLAENGVQSITVQSGKILVPVDAERLAGSYTLLDAEVLRNSRVFTFDEALRKVAGVNTRQEEGFGQRPNIGVRGLNPTRSSKVLLLEDGLPLSYAPYGDNASYYHPPVDRFQEVEVVKGGGQILFGPMTVGGVINYITPSIPAKRGGSLTLFGGNRDYLNAHMQYGFNWKRTGVLVDGLRKQGEGSRENTRLGITDFNVKTLTSLTPAQALSVKFNRFEEGSQVTYSGLTESEWLANPRFNPFLNDRFDTQRYGTSAQHSWTPSANVLLVTNAYGNVFLRDWWRQSSNSLQRPNDPRCGGMANLLSTCGNEGRLRSYYTWGVEPKLRVSREWRGVRHDFDLGVRYHDELQERIQENGLTPAARTGVRVENNQRIARAGSGFLQDRLTWRKLSVSAGLRFEKMRFTRTNRLANAGAGVFGTVDLSQVIPGIGASYAFSEKLTVFTGLHRGFAPPRVEDVISNNTGASVDLSPERSWNYEAGLRSRLNRETTLEATYFRMDFQNQIVPASVAGGPGATLTNAGETLHEGAEFAARWMKRGVAGSAHGIGLSGSYTWLPVARFLGTRFSTVSGFTNVLVTGRRTPYAPEHLMNATLHYVHTRGMNAQIETVYTGRQFADDLNTIGGTRDGQRGRIPSAIIWNATVNYPVERLRSTFFVTTKNLTDRLYVVDRARGLLPGMPRLVQGGVRVEF